MKRVAIVGFGFMGRTHYGAWKKCRGAKVVAVCVTNLAHLKAEVHGNIEGVIDNSELPKAIRLFDSFDELLKAGGFDIVDITTPTPLHPQMAIAALEAGCHVLCEKPMALEVNACERMLAAARKAERQLLVAQCVRFFPEYIYLRRLIRSGRYGAVLAADFTRFMSAPRWSLNGQRGLLDEAQSGGLYLDAHVHDADYILSVFGKPKSVTSLCHRSPLGYIDHTTTTYGYDDRLVTSDSSFAGSDSLKWDAAARVFLEKATVYLGGAYRSPLTVYPTGDKPFTPNLPKATGYEAEVRYFLDLVEGKTPTEIVLTAEDARDAVALVLAERRSAETGRMVWL